MAGAVEGLTEGLEKFRVEENAADAVHESGRLVREVTSAVRSEARRPESRRLAREARHGAHAVQERASSAAQEVRHTAQEVTDSAQDRWGDMKESASEAVDRVQHRMQAGAERVQHAAHVTAEETRERGSSLAEAARRAMHAPGNAWNDVRKSMGARARGMGAGIGLFALAGAVATAAFVVLTVALVSWLNGLVGEPGGAFIVALAYFIGAGAAVAAAIAARRKAREQADQHMDDARAEFTAVVQPIRRAFSGHRIAYQADRRQDVGRVEVPAAQQPDQHQVDKYSAGRSDEVLASSISDEAWRRR